MELSGEEVAGALADLQRLRTTLLSDITMFRRLGLSDDTPFRKLPEQEVFEGARQAESTRNAADEEFSTMAEAFFSFLASQQLLLEVAAAAGMKVLHVQFHG